MHEIKFTLDGNSSHHIDQNATQYPNDADDK